MQIHHFGFATKSIENSLAEFKKLGYNPVSEKIVDPIQKVELLFINNSDHLIELIAPLKGEDNPVKKILDKSGSSLYHICYEVENIRDCINTLRAKGFIVILKPTPAIAFNNRNISFLYNSHTGIIELLEK